MRKTDLYNIVFGALVAIVATGIYDSVFFLMQGPSKVSELWSSFYATILTLVIFIGYSIFFFKILQKKNGSKATESKPTPQNGKKSISKLNLAVILSIISLVVSSLFAGIGVYLTTQANQLTEQAIEIADKSLNLQNMQSNYTTSIITSEVTSVLDRDGYFTNSTDFPTKSSGWLNGSITIYTPSLGRLFISKANFTADDEFSSLIPEKVNDTRVSFDTGYSVYNPDDFAFNVNNTGFNVIDYRIPLIAECYPNAEKLPSLPESATTLPIGHLLLEAKLETLTGITFTEYYWARILVVIRTNF